MSAQALAELLKTLPDARFHRKLQLVTWHPRGLFDDALADDIARLVESAAFLEAKPCYSYTDFSGLTEIRLKLGHLFQFAERRHEANTPAKSAFVAQSVVGFGIARMYEHLMRTARIDVRAFRERSAAAEWLGVPVEVLEPAPGEDTEADQVVRTSNGSLADEGTTKVR